MNFVLGLLHTKNGHDSIWIMTDFLSQLAHVLPIKATDSFDKLVSVYIAKIVCLHGALVSIVSNRDIRFTSQFWSILQNALGTKLKFSITFRPLTNRQSKRTIQTLKDMLRAYVMEFKGR